MDINRNDIRRFVIAANSYDGAYQMVCKKMGIKSNMLWLLYAMDDGELHTQKQICEDWLIPKTTVNTLIKECESVGHVTLHSIPSKRELQICLTESGKAYARKALNVIYKAEENALQLTLQEYDPSFMLTFVLALESFVENIKIAFEKASEEME